MRMRPFFVLGLSISLSAVCSAADITASHQTAASAKARAGEPEFRDLYRELIEINTTLSVGNCTDAANAMKARLSAAGYPESKLHVVVPPDQPRGGNLVAE